MTILGISGFTWGNNQDQENLFSTKKKRSSEEECANKKQKTFKEHQLEWLIRNAVESAIRPLREELTQMKKMLQEKEQQEGKRQEERKEDEEKQNKKSQKENEHGEKKGKQNEKEKTQNYSEVLQNNLPNKEDGWKMVTNKKTKKRFPIEQRRLLFKLESGQHPKSQPQDLLHLANQILRKKQAEGVSFIQLNYTPTGQISVVLSEQANREMVKPFLPAIQQAFQEAKVPVRSIGAAETWSKLKVHLVPISRYFRPEGLELAREEIEATLGYQLPTAIRWLKKAEAIQENQEKDIKHTSIVVTVPSEDTAQSLKARGLYFGGKRHPVEDFFENSREVCPDCCQIGHRKNCTNPHKCFLCAGNHHRKDHYCTECNAKTPCKHIPLKCANCNGKHEAVNPSCLVARGKREGRLHRTSPPQAQTPTPKQMSMLRQTPETRDTIVVQLEQQGTEYDRTPIIISSEGFPSSFPPTPTPMEMDRQEPPSTPPQ
jgi:hypothetical protein